MADRKREQIKGSKNERKNLAANLDNDQNKDLSMDRTGDDDTYEFNTGRTERVNSREHTLNTESKETDMLREKTADNPGAHQEGQYDKNQP